MLDTNCPLGEICSFDRCVIDTGADRDRDGVPDRVDTCPDLANTDQDDLDGDGQGDECDADDDNDGVPDDEDNCPEVPNPDRRDRRNHDGVGDACEPDSDYDGVPDYRDNCVGLANPDQRDTDHDTAGDACDLDDDGDGIADLDDACPVSILTWCYMDKNFDFDSDLANPKRPVVGVDVTGLGARKFPPTAIGFDADLAENLPSTRVGTVAVTDVNSGETHSFAITDGNDDELFAVDATGDVSTTGPLDFESAVQHVLSVTVTDSGGLSATALATVNVTDVNEPPSLAGFTTSVPEGEPPTVLGTVVGTDPDAGDVLTYSITSGNALGLLAIDSASGEVSTTSPLDFEASSTHNLIATVGVTDVGGLSASAIIFVQITNVREAPLVLPFQASIDENQPPTVLGNVMASDPDGDEALTFAITSGNEAGLFAIGTETGELSTTAALDFDEASQHVLEVSVKDSDGLVTSALATITVNDVDDPSGPLFVEGDLYLFSTDYPGSATRKTLVKIDPAKPDPDTDAAKTVILGLDDISDGKALVAYDPVAQRLVLSQGLPRQFHFVDAEGTITATLPLRAADPSVGLIAVSCTGRLYYYWPNGGGVSFNYLDPDGTVHPVGDGAGNPFKYILPLNIRFVTRMIYDRTTHSLILTHYTDEVDSKTVVTKYPLDAAGTDIAGPVDTSSPVNAALPVPFLRTGGEVPVGLSAGPGNTLLVSVNFNAPSAQVLTIDPTDLSAATFAHVDLNASLATTAGTYNHLYSYDAILNTSADVIRTFVSDADPANIQDGDVLTSGTGTAGGSGAAATLISIGDTIGGGCP